jgi:hypothetical protein
VPENVSISYRGANYAIGQGPQFYGIWYAAAPQSQPLEWWPHTPEGWSAAWSKFTAIEVPGSIAPAASPAARAQAVSTADPAPEPANAGRNSRIAAAVLALGVVLGVAGLFPTYIDGTSLASLGSSLVPHVIYLAAWSLSALLIVLGGTRRRIGSLIGLGTSVVTFGLFLADAGTPIAGGAHLMGAGLVLSILGWLACTAGTVLAFRIGPADRLARRVSTHELVPTVTLILAALGAAIAFAPSWDSFTLRTAAGLSQTVTAGNAFANPAPVIVGDLAVMVALVAVVAVAAFWRPIRLGAALVAGAIIPMAAQAISALVELPESTSPLQFGISQSQAAAVGLTISSGLTPMFWVYCAFLATLILLCVWMLVSQDSAMSIASPWQSPNPGPYEGTGQAGVAPSIQPSPSPSPAPQQ